jgi:hypothetical protein
MRKRPLLLYPAIAVGTFLASCADFENTLSNLAANPAFQDYSRQAVNWVVENFGSTALGKSVPLRDPPTGPVEGRWIMTGFTAKEQPNNSLAVTMTGFGYRGHPDAKNVTFTSSAWVTYWTAVAKQGDWLIVTFKPVGQPRVSFEPRRIDGFLASLFDGFVSDKGRQAMLERVQRGFTVMWKEGRRMRMQLGIVAAGQLSDADLEGKPDAILVQDEARIHEDGRDFLGPFQLGAGESIQVDVKTDCSWGLDACLLDHATAQQLLFHHFDPRAYAAPSGSVLTASDGSTRWKATYRAQQDGWVWLVVDNTDGGKAKPPSNGVDDVLRVSVSVSR